MWIPSEAPMIDHASSRPARLGDTLAKTLAGAAAVVAMVVVGAPNARAQVSYRQSGRSGKSDYHVVKNGDTMWDLSGRYYGDNYQWPRMWSYNAHITNPHWIYPGDIIYLRPKSSGGGASRGASEETKSSDGGIQQVASGFTSGFYMPLGGYITRQEVQYVGRITASRKAASMLGEHDTAWVGWGQDAYTDEERQEIDRDERLQMAKVGQINEGDKFAVVRETGQVTNDDDEVIGHKYIVLGAVEVTKTAKNHYDEVKITQSWQEIYRGDALIPYERQAKVIERSAATGDLGARIIDTLKPGSIFGEQAYVFLNRGAEDGLRMGNRFFVHQRYEGLHKGIDGKLNEKIPWTRVGQVLVIDVREHYSTAVVLDAKRELVVGDHLDMYKGR